LVVIAGVVVSGGVSSSAQSSCTPSSGSSCTAPGRPAAPDPTTLIGSAPPATTGKNLTGKGSLSLATLLGKPAAVVFWLNTCPHCRKALPEINRLRSKLGADAQLVTAAINAGLKGPKGFETPAAAVKTLHLRIPTMLVANNVAMKKWLVASTPTVYIIDSSRVVTQVLQPTPSDNLADQIESALAQTQ
jgi:thiol-disulfide isomerase/thioredoxin